jgi:hypothetical protein
MRLDFYYSFPNGSELLDTNHSLAFDIIFERSKNNYKHIECNKFDYHCVAPEIYDPKIHNKLENNSTPSAFMIIINPDNKKYFIISYWDKYIGAISLWDLENCIEEFAYYGMHKNDYTYEQYDRKYTAIPPMAFTHLNEKHVEEVYRKKISKITPEKPYFRSGNPYLFREHIHKYDNRFISHNVWIDSLSFVEEMAKNSIVIDINSVAEFSHRTVQALGLGCALIRPKLKAKLYKDLINNYNYAEVECDDLSDYKLLADAYIDKFEQLKKDKDLVNYIATNGRKYYEENCTLDVNVNILEKLIDLNKLM